MPDPALSYRSGRNSSTPISILSRKPAASDYNLTPRTMRCITALEISHKESDMDDAKLTGMTRCLASRLRALNLKGHIPPRTEEITLRIA